MISGRLDVPYVPTRQKYLETIVSAVGAKPSDIVYELGCGDGRFLISAWKKEPAAKYVGIERNPLLVVLVRFRLFLAGNPENIVLRRGDFFKTDLSQATRVYAYLLPGVMEALLPKCERELKNALFVSNTFSFPRKTAMRSVQLSKQGRFTGERYLYTYEF